MLYWQEKTTRNTHSSSSSSSELFFSCSFLSWWCPETLSCCAPLHPWVFTFFPPSSLWCLSLGVTDRDFRAKQPIVTSQHLDQLWICINCHPCERSLWWRLTAALIVSSKLWLLLLKSDQDMVGRMNQWINCLLWSMRTEVWILRSHWKNWVVGSGEMAGSVV